MTRLRFEEAATRVKDALDIVEAVQRHVPLKKTGRNYTGKCPFHNDTHPSMQVSREKNLFKCFACGVGGDALTFLMRIGNRTYGEIIRDLAQEQGIDILSDRMSADASAARQDTEQKILALNRAAADWFQNNLQDNLQNPFPSRLEMDTGAETARRYLAGRYPDAEQRRRMAADFQLGYAPDGREHLTTTLKAQFDFVRANPTLLAEAGLASVREYGQGHYDRFRDRLIIPIEDEKGRVVAFAGRTLSDEHKPKYLNSPETAVYHKSRILYGINRAKDAIRKSGFAIVMEGYFDVITAHLAGITEAVGSCGTAITERHLKLLTRFGAETVYLAFDSDEPGLKAALNAIALIEGTPETVNLRVRVLTLPGGKDPDAFIRARGDAGGEAFRALLQDAAPYLTFKLDMAIRDLDVTTPEGRIQAADRLTPLLAAIDRPVVRSEAVKQYAEKIGLSEEALLLEVRRHQQRHATSRARRSGATQNSGHDFDSRRAIFDPVSTSLQRQAISLPEIRSTPRDGLAFRRTVIEKDLLRLALYSMESLTALMDVLMNTLDTNRPESDNLILSGLIFSGTIFSDPRHQTLWDRLCDALTELSDSPHAVSSGTLIARMNHLYSENSDKNPNDSEVRNVFAELALTAETLGESLGLETLSGAALREKVTALSHRYLEQLSRCNQLQRLQAIRSDAQQQQEDPAHQTALTYQFQEQLGTGLTPGGPASVSGQD